MARSVDRNSSYWMKPSPLESKTEKAALRSLHLAYSFSHTRSTTARCHDGSAPPMLSW